MACEELLSVLDIILPRSWNCPFLFPVSNQTKQTDMKKQICRQNLTKCNSHCIIY